jgi:hypothetical protein
MTIDAKGDAVAQAEENYAADWVQNNLNALAKRKGKTAHQLSEFDRRAVSLLQRAMGTGVYNLQVNWGKVDWFGYGVRFVLFSSGLSTWDFNHLTRLVILAHDECIRVDVSPCAPRYLAIMMHPRVREGAMSQRHPTIEDAIAAVRGLS